jgi:phosphoribosylformimino-5-aminoimidazole carboxamide ribotide isomerase
MILLLLRAMFRPCIDLHEGKVKQIVGGTLGDAGGPRTNFASDRSAAWYAELYKRDSLRGGHVIMLGPGNEAEARAALAAYPGGLQIGGGVNAENARRWLEAGASHVIVTSWVFREGRVDWARLNQLVETVGKSRLVLDLSCRRPPLTRPSATLSPIGGEGRVRGQRVTGNVNDEPVSGSYFVVTDRWQKFTELEISADTLQTLAGSCAEFLIHAVDVEGLCRGIDRELVAKLGAWSPIPTTYAGGASSIADLDEVARLAKGKIDLTIGSALDIFGGKGVRYEDAVAFNRRQAGRHG